MIGHTPGPWKVRGLYGDVGTDTRLCATAGPIADPVNHANSRLIAAAPELLEALKSLLNWQVLAERDDVPMIGMDFERARKVVKKAIGAP